MPDVPRYEVWEVEGAYPVVIIDRVTGGIEGRYYRASLAAARDHCRALNEGKRPLRIRWACGVDGHAHETRGEAALCRLALARVRVQEGVEYLYYGGADMNEFRLPRRGDWALLRACIDDAERRATYRATATEGRDD